MVSKDDITREATKLFAQKGFKATSIIDISKAVNLSASAGGIYRHFPSKRAIFDAIFDSYYGAYDTFLENVSFNLGANSGDHKKALAHGLINMSLQQALADKDTIKLYFREQDRLSDKHKAQAQKLRENSIQSFKYVCQYVAGADIHFDAEATAAILIDSINFRVCGFAPDFGISEERFVSTLTDLLFILVMNNNSENFDTKPSTE